MTRACLLWYVNWGVGTLSQRLATWAVHHSGYVDGALYDHLRSAPAHSLERHGVTARRAKAHTRAGEEGARAPTETDRVVNEHVGRLAGFGSEAAVGLSHTPDFHRCVAQLADSWSTDVHKDRECAPESART